MSEDNKNSDLYYAAVGLKAYGTDGAKKMINFALKNGVNFLKKTNILGLENKDTQDK